MTDSAPLDSRKNETYNTNRSVVQGVTWAVLMRWVMRFIGLFSTLVLARLLTPEDFGIVAMAMLVVQLLFELSEFGASTQLIRAREIDRHRCDTAWTINLLQHLLTALALVALAIPTAHYFEEPRLVEVMLVLALATFIGAFENIGPVLLRRDLKFVKDFNFNVWKKVLVFITTVSGAIIFRNYWALLMGNLVGKTAGVVLSYLMHSYRPRWSLHYAGEFIRFGTAIVPLRLAITLRGMISSFLVAGLGNPTILGAYRLSNDISGVFTREIVGPMGRGLLPNYARLADNRKELASVYKKMVGLVALVCVPIGVGVATVADDLVLILFGPQWDLAAQLMKYLGISAAILALTQAMVGQVLVVIGRERTAAALAWLRLLVSFPIMWTGLQLGGIFGLAKASIVAGLACLPFIYYEIRRSLHLSFPALLGLLWRPIVAAVIMHGAIRWFPTPELDWVILRLMLDVALGAATFASVVLMLWIFSGRPAGTESIFINMAVRFASQLRRS